MRAFLVVIALTATAYRLFPGGFPSLPGQRWDWREVTIKGFRAGTTREQIETRLGPGKKQEREEWWWSPPLPPIQPGGVLPTITFEMLSLEKREHRWYLHGSQFECNGQTLITMIHGPDSVSQGTVQAHFGEGFFSGEGDSLALNSLGPEPQGVKLSFGINTVDEFGPGFTRSVWGTTISWPDASEPIHSSNP